MPDETSEPVATETSSQPSETAQGSTQSVDAPAQQAETAQPTADLSQQQMPTTPAQPQEQAAAQQQDQATAQWESDNNPYRKRFNDIQPHASRLFNEVKEWRDLNIKPDQVRQMIDEQRRMQAASQLKPWNAGHQEYQRFKQLRASAGEFRKAMQQAGEDPVKQDFVKQLYQGKFSNEDLQMIQQAEIDRQDQLERLQSDPAGFIAQHVDSLIAQKFSQYEQYQQTRSDVGNWFSQNKQLVDRYAPDMARMMDPQVPAREKAIEYAAMKAELDQLRNKLGETAQQDLQQNARQTLMNKGQRQTHFTKQQARQDIGDPVQYLTKKGFQPGTQEFAVQLDKLNKSLR